MGYRSGDLTANADNIGDWGNAEANAEAIRRWNEYIVPVLETAIPDDDPMMDGGIPTVMTGPIMAQEADQWAWEQFCGRGAGDSDEAAKKLANDLQSKLAH